MSHLMKNRISSNQGLSSSGTVGGSGSQVGDCGGIRADGGAGGD